MNLFFNILRSRLNYVFFVIYGIITVFSGDLSAHAMDYYVDRSGGSDLNNGGSQAAPWQTITKVNSILLSPGDNVYFKRGEVWEEKLIISSSGIKGSPVTFGAYGTGNNPKIKCSNTFSNWHLIRKNGKIKVWKETIEGVKNSWGACKDGVRIPAYREYRTGKDKKWSAPVNVEEMRDAFFFSPYNSESFYLRNDKGNPGGIEVGVREYGIQLDNQSFVIIDSIDVCGPGGGTRDGSPSGFKLISINNCEYIHIRNLSLSCSNGIGAMISNGSTYCVYENVLSYGHKSTGLYFWEAGEGNKALDCEVYNCGRLSTDFGDKGLIGIFKTPGVEIRSCYVHDNGHNDMTSIDSGISFVASLSGSVKYSHIKNTGGTGIQFASSSDYCEASYNIIDNWGVYGRNIKKWPSNEGIRIGGGGGSSTAKGCRIYNNLFINGGKTAGKYAALRILKRANCGLEVKNNIFHNNIGIYEIFAQSKDNFKEWAFSNNIYYRTKGQAININGEIYDYKKIIGEKPSYYSYDHTQEKGSMAADPKMIYDKKALSPESDCIDAGVYVGLSSDYNGKKVPAGKGVDIGPFEYY